MTATAAWSFTAVASSRRREVNSSLLTPFLVLTNRSIHSRRDLAARLRVTGLEIPEGAIAGLEAGLETILLLTGVATRAEAERHPYRASCIVGSIADLVDTRGSALSRDVDDTREVEPPTFSGLAEGQGFESSQNACKHEPFRALPG